LQAWGGEYDRALFVKSDDIRKARGKQSGKYRKPSAIGVLSIISIFYLTCSYFRDTHESSPNSSEFYGSDGRPYTHVVTDKISKSTVSAFG